MDSTEVNRALNQLGLSQYINIFKENEVNDISLESIDKEDIAQLVPVVGHRAMIWNALSKLKSGSVYVCFSCQKGFIRLKDLASHLTRDHNLTGGSEYRCSTCQGLFNRKSFLQHLRNSYQVHRELEWIQNDTTEADNQNQIEDIVFNETEDQDSFSQALEEIEKHIMGLMCSIMKSGKVPLSTADSIISKVKDVVKITVEKLISMATSLVTSSLTNEYKLSQIQKFEKAYSLFSKVDTKYKLDKYLIDNDLIVMPRQVVLDSDISFSSTIGNGQVQRYKPVSMQYIPIKNSILQLLSIPGFFETLEMNKSFNGEWYSNFREGSFFQTPTFLRNTIFINIYYDDAEIANPLGSKSGKHKLANFYFSLLDMPQHMLSSIDNVLLLASLKTVDLKTSSVNAVLEVIVTELKELWNEGLTFLYNDKPITLKVALAQVSGDNLGLHTVLGFTEGFNANYPCRRCKMHRNECKIATYECTEKLRNLCNYDNDILLKDFPSTGINFESILNELPYLHVTNIYVFDIMHDILEGVAPDLLFNSLNNFIKKKYLSLDKLNYRLESFDYGRGYKTTKPSQVKSTFLKGEGKIGQNAAQTLCLMIFFPLLVGDLIPQTDETWSLFLLFREIMLIVLADSISAGGVIYLETIISEFLSSYQSTFKKSLKPKHHHLTHYASSIEQIGPLRHFWSMPFEAKHKFFKTAAHAACNFKNVAKTLAYRHQLSLCFRLQSKEKFTPISIEYEERAFSKMETSHFSNILVERFGSDEINNAKAGSQVSCNGCEFEIGSIVVVKYCSLYPIFGVIKLIVFVEDSCYLLVDLHLGEYNPHFSCFSVESANELRIIDIHEIDYYQPVYPARSFKDNDINNYVNLAFKRV
ncbi:unnamed protein product [Orchesella dallaii]|uniref:C2H2-type domain-containing protein n=1 Tax=Orchesella dallaii TaxID=48710 RepID=A0ABP1QND9_9HEXA